MQSERLVNKLSSKSAIIRSLTLNKLKKLERTNSSLIPRASANFINLNVHTKKSFSPYTPALGAYMAYKSGITLAGVCDYGSVGSVKEFQKSCLKLGIGYLGGVEFMLNDSVLGNFIASFYGINNKNASAFDSILQEFREICKSKTQALTERLNKKLKKFDIFIDYEKEVLPITESKKGGTVTLKHVYMALSQKIIAKYGKGKQTADFLRNQMCLDMEECDYNLLCDANDPYYVYDLISTLRTRSKPVDDNISYLSAKKVLEIALNQGLICAYQYDKTPNWIVSEKEREKSVEQFKAEILQAKELGFNAVCLCPKSLGLSTVSAFCECAKQNEMLVVFNEKTEYPRNRFDIVSVHDCKDYVEASAYAILGNAISILMNAEDGMFTSKTLSKCPNFSERLGIFGGIGKRKV